MNLLIIGSGAREHTMAWKLNRSPKARKIYTIPGNVGMANIGKCFDINPSDFKSIQQIVLQENIGMVIVGPENPLEQGIVDFFHQEPSLQNVSIIGPTKKAAILESSKAYAKAFMNKYHIPTAKSISVTKQTIDQGRAFLQKQYPPYVLKADGLAAGKGVLIVDYQKKAEITLEEMLNGQFGKASHTVVIEEYLDGIEMSCFVLIDNNSYLILPYAKDYKRIGEKDTGLNTGGMGAISPVPFITPEMNQKIENDIVIPTVHGIRQENLDFKGILFIGLINVNGQPKVMEYNVRFGDPEAEVVIPRINNDLLDLFSAVAHDTLSEIQLDINPQSAATVMAVSGGYPTNYNIGEHITGVEETHLDHTFIFHAGTKMGKNHRILTNGGRVLTVTSLGTNHQQALERSYKRMESIDFERKYIRRDIGYDL
ncbi:MAG: phosphoribosylamine--glycine ligase [Flavobacteriaceae bacterium]|nr:phosphoribosylamine--glycine ligase [Flavobacteriaceae bacterium]MCY4267214.1 phosphoribosylamine--glycine ligase [Flavobacteriaceae bacterium]MCY4298170.1 phosphoribosylamine--glycine ligase [Flavobacteriaceae bacterium]